MDTVSAANASLAAHRAAAVDSAVNRATCKRCGSNDVGWVKSGKTGRWYLANGYTDSGVPSNKIIVVSWNFHSKTCSPAPSA